MKHTQKMRAIPALDCPLCKKELVRSHEKNEKDKWVAYYDCFDCDVQVKKTFPYGETL